MAVTRGHSECPCPGATPQKGYWAELQPGLGTRNVLKLPLFVTHGGSGDGGGKVLRLHQLSQKELLAAPAGPIKIIAVHTGAGFLAMVLQHQHLPPGPGECCILPFLSCLLAFSPTPCPWELRFWTSVLWLPKGSPFHTHLFNLQYMWQRWDTWN